MAEWGTSNRPCSVYFCWVGLDIILKVLLRFHLNWQQLKSYLFSQAGVTVYSAWRLTASHGLDWGSISVPKSTYGAGWEDGAIFGSRFTHWFGCRSPHGSVGVSSSRRRVSRCRMHRRLLHIVPAGRFRMQVLMTQNVDVHFNTVSVAYQRQTFPAITEFRLIYKWL